MQFYIDDALFHRMAENLAKQLTHCLELKIEGSELHSRLLKYSDAILTVFDIVYESGLSGVDEANKCTNLMRPILVAVAKELSGSYLINKDLQKQRNNRKSIETLVDVELMKILPIMYRRQKTRPVKLS